MKLKGRVAIVTGAGRGIGQAYARALVAEGARVVIAELRVDVADETAQAIKSGGGEALAVQTDVGDPDSVGAMVERTVGIFGGVDILVNNAAIFADDVGWNPLQWSWLTGDMDRYHMMMRVNVESLIHATRAVAPHMRARGKGKIVNQSSMGGFMSSLGLYGFTKLNAAVVTRSLAIELAGDGICVNAIAPGIIDTPTVRYRGGRTAREAEEYLTSTAAMIPMGRVGHPSDLTGCLVWLASDQADYITGQTIIIDGGWNRQGY